MEAREKLMKENGLTSRLTPATMAVSIRPDWIAATASLSATSEEEQAVSTVKLGPRRSKMYEIRLEIRDSVLPVAKYWSPEAMSNSLELP